jgi:NADPH2:quinone reductase
MRALVARRLDGPATVELIETPIPEPGAGQVRIKVAAAAVNPVDVATTDGTLINYNLSAPREQFGIGWDVAGTVDAVGPGADLPVGTAVIGVADLLGRPLKTHAEYVVLNASAAAPAPARLELAAASTFGLNALTAHQALDAVALNAGQTLLVTGAAGGVGGYAVELGKHRGLTVIATAGEDDEQLVRSLGADHFVPRSADLTAAVHALVPARRCAAYLAAWDHGVPDLRRCQPGRLGGAGAVGRGRRYLYQGCRNVLIGERAYGVRAIG